MYWITHIYYIVLLSLIVFHLQFFHSSWTNISTKLRICISCFMFFETLFSTSLFPFWNLNTILKYESSQGSMHNWVDHFGCHAIQLCYRNLSFWLMTKVKACKDAGQKGIPGVTLHAPMSAKECEGMNLHTPKWTPILGVGVPNGFPSLERAIAGVKIHWMEALLISLESFWNEDAWNGLSWPIWTFEMQVMAKRRAVNQIGNLTPNH
jgi:hypothetical protein